MRIAIIRFPGANCDADTLWAMHDAMGQEAEYVWHKEERFRHPYDAVVLPGGFSYGDYLRPGAIARFSPIMAAVARHAAEGGLTVGICNGFQVLTEAGLLPGALARNRQLRFISQDVFVRVERVMAPWTLGLSPGKCLRLPIAHMDGAYTAHPEVLAQLREENRILLRYVSPAGKYEESWNVNGAADAIAGIVNQDGNVFGLMPHPERAMAAPPALSPRPGYDRGMPLGGSDGRLLLECWFGGAEVAA